MSQRDYAREEHANWVHAMRTLRDVAGIDVNAIPRDEFVKFEEALRDWAVSYVRSVGA